MRGRGAMTTRVRMTTMRMRSVVASVGLAVLAACGGDGGAPLTPGPQDVDDTSHTAYVPPGVSFEALVPGASQSFAADEFLDAIALIDIDATPGLDVALAFEDPTTTWTNTRRNLGSRIFNDNGGGGFVGSPQHAFLVAGDFEDDGRIDDFAASAMSDNGIHVYFQTWDGPSSGGSGIAFYPDAADDAPSGLAGGDWDGDGLEDVAVSYPTLGGIVIHVANAPSGINPQMGPGALFATTGREPKGLVAGDFDGDGDDDLAAIDQLTGEVIVMRSLGDGTFEAPVALWGAGPSAPVTALLAADLDGDGRADLAGLRGPLAADFVVWRGRADGDFETRKVTPLTLVPVLTGVTVATGDLNGDGIADVALAMASLDKVLVLRGRGDGTFVEGPLPDVGDEPVGVAVGDVDGDGFTDVAVAARSAHRFDVLWGQAVP